MQLIIQTDASNTSWGAVCRGNITEGTWSYQKKTRHINVLELIAVKLVILTFTGVNRLQQSTYKYYSSVLLDKIESSSQSRTATSNQGNMGLSVSRSISNKVDWQSRNDKDSSDRKLNPNIFSQIGKIKEYLKQTYLLPNSRLNQNICLGIRTQAAVEQVPLSTLGETFTGIHSLYFA